MCLQLAGSPGALLVYTGVANSKLMQAGMSKAAKETQLPAGHGSAIDLGCCNSRWSMCSEVIDCLSIHGIEWLKCNRMTQLDEADVQIQKPQADFPPIIWIRSAAKSGK